ncbi:hypothetical protein PF008_g14232 [Phytophthora fragariae]|uniref:Uncharacterized protein n=1 Tax=Phytophthora fragariae TaxID=53985 RepID=A0A6G0RHR5_9STRA|nr:hypothetical protein PF008_g14232 [Phytophthora fragariae]
MIRSRDSGDKSSRFLDDVADCCVRGGVAGGDPPELDAAEESSDSPEDSSEARLLPPSGDGGLLPSGDPGGPASPGEPPPPRGLDGRAPLSGDTKGEPGEPGAAGDGGLADDDDDTGTREASLPSADSPPDDPRVAEGEGGAIEGCWSPGDSYTRQ